MKTPEEWAETVVPPRTLLFTGDEGETRQAIAAVVRSAVAEERERCAKVCEQTHEELDAEFSSDNGCTDTAIIAAERIRRGPTP